MRRREAIAGLTGLAALQMPDTVWAETVLRGADVHVDGYPTVLAVQWLGAELERRTDGRLRLVHYPAGQLGREADTLTLVRHGALALTRVTIAALNNAFPDTALLSMPYVFDDVGHLRRALDGDPGRRLLAHLSSRGQIALCFYDAGVRGIYNIRHPVATPADLKGLKLRVPASDVFLTIMRRLGVNATPLAFGEVYSALQTGLIDGAENNWMSFVSSRQFEVAKHWSSSEHSMVPDVLLLSAAVDARLQPQDRELIRDLAQQSVGVMRAAWDRALATARQRALASGVVETAIDRQAFAQAVEPLIAELATGKQAGLYAAIRSLA